MRHGGYTHAFPKGRVEHKILLSAAMLNFTHYAEQRPQLRFGEPELRVDTDILRHTERGAWDAQSELVWS